MSSLSDQTGRGSKQNRRNRKFRRKFKDNVEKISDENKLLKEIFDRYKKLAELGNKKAILQKNLRNGRITTISQIEIQLLLWPFACFQIALGVVLFIKKSDIEGIVSTAVIGSGSTVTLVGSLASLKTLFKDNKEGITQTVNTLAGIPNETDTNGKIVTKFHFDLAELRKELNPLRFMENLNRHMQYMLICRTILVSLVSLVSIILTVVAISVVASNRNKKIKDDDIFSNMIITLISFSVFCLWCTICVRICLQIIIPKVIADVTTIAKEAKEAKENNEQNSSSSLLEKYKKDYVFKDIFKKSSLSNKILLISFLNHFHYYCLVELSLSFDQIKIKRISMTDEELEEINRVLFGLPTITVVTGGSDVV
ncbi:unnamed protein product [Rhizophagus irregularis]|nr:unnamed protein product [Rhizophagus irregularis]